MSTDMQSRRRGVLLGLAVGDAVGATYEFCHPDEVPGGPLEMAGGGWLGLEPGEITDDTELTLAVLEGYEGGELDLRRVREAIVRWYGPPRPKDVGNQTEKAILYLKANPEALSLPEDPGAQGNGTVMRAAPHGLMTESPSRAAANAWEEAALTHPSWQARASSALVAALVARLVEGSPPEEALERSYADCEDICGGTLREELPPLDEFRHYPDGWTVYTTRLALLALLEAGDYRSGVETVVRLGGDADTNHAVAGALLGARFGVEDIPGEWLRVLKAREELEGYP